MRRTPFTILILLTLLAVGCSTDSEPEPTPDIGVTISAPDTMYKDNLRPISIQFSHPDGFTGSVKYTIDGEDMFSRQLNTQQWDTTFTPTLPQASEDVDTDS